MLVTLPSFSELNARRFSSTGAVPAFNLFRSTPPLHLHTGALAAVFERRVGATGRLRAWRARTAAGGRFA